jgi:nucleoside-diphosphate-sugar epimerase
MRYLVTGGTGLVGGHLIDRLREAGDEVRALVRRPAVAEELRRRGVDSRLGDLADARDLPAAVEGVDVVVHAAGVVQVMGEHRELWAVNVEGTERLLEASARAGLRRFVHLSSVAVYGPAPAPIAEDAPKRPVGPYGQSKWAAEQALWRRHAEGGLPAVALRPCIIYGGRDRHAWPVLERLRRMRVLPLPRGGRRLIDLVHVSDVVDAVMAASTAPEAVGRAYNLTDGERHSIRDILEAYGRIAGRRPAILPIPGPVWGLALRVRSRLRAFDLDFHYAIDAARRDLGYRPRVGLVEGLSRTLREAPLAVAPS